MFTGIIEEMGEIAHIKQISEQAVQLQIKANKITEDMQIGDSIAINGICLTVISFTQTTFEVEAMPETIKATSLSNLQEGSVVNLERALHAKGRFGGHFVTGHVDTVGKIVAVRPVENAVYYDIHITEEWLPYFIHKGSVAVDGISLTIFAVDTEKKEFSLSLIPHTVDVTVLGQKKIGDIVNIECDMLAKHVHHYMQQVSNTEDVTKCLIQ